MNRVQAGDMIRRVSVAIALCLLGAACGDRNGPVGAEPLPVGAQIVRISVSNTQVVLEPREVQTGDVYLMVDQGSISFVSRQAAADAEPGPLSDAELARLALGDRFHTSTTGVDAGGCSPEQDLAARGMLGPCGNVLQVTVLPGKYAVIGGPPDVDPVTGRMAPMAVLEVTP